MASQKNSASVQVTRRPIDERYEFTKIPFVYSTDDYRYIPGLHREHDVGYLAPVFFNRRVLFKYDVLPGYRMRFASRTYGQIVDDDGNDVAFGVNRNGKIIMWLGDIAKLPESEQYYLRSENIESDHSIGSEFYDGQIECIFTEPAPEDRLFGLRPQFFEACLIRFEAKLAHLDKEVVELALQFSAPIIDSIKVRREVCDALNKIYVESIDGPAIEKVLAKEGIASKGLGSLKRLKLLLEPIAKGADLDNILMPLFVLYDLRVAYSHLTSDDRASNALNSAVSRLQIGQERGFVEIYVRLRDTMISSYRALIAIVES
jgi:hypothetical protein